MPTMDWTRASCRLLAATAAEFARTRPFAGLSIGTAIHLEPKTATLLLTLVSGGAQVVATGNLNTTRPDTVAALRAGGVTVVGDGATSPQEQASAVRTVLRTRPDLLLDNGGELFAHYADDPYPHLLGGTEETTSGRVRLTPLRERFGRPIIVVNDSPIKQFAENHHAVGQSVVESFMRLTNRATNGRRVTVVGYGPCGRGIARTFRHAHARVSVLERDPVRRLEALFDGFAVPDREEAIATADVIVTATGAPGVIRGEDVPLLADDVIIANAGHLPWEIDVPALLHHPEVRDRAEPADGVRSLTLAGGRRVHLLTDGHLVNLTGPRPLGNSVEAMDLGFTLQARCLEAVARGRVTPEMCLVPVPDDINARVAAAYVALANGRPRPVASDTPR